MSLIRRIFRKRKESETPGTFVMDIDWERSEELRVDRLGPAPEDVPDPERVQVERWRPSRTLGPPFKH